jgi:hypothetical protein
MTKMSTDLYRACALLLVSLAVVPIMEGPVEALQLNPDDFSSLGTVSATNDIIINSDTLQLSGGASFIGILDPVSHAAVFTFDNIQAGNISVLGASPLALLSRGNAIFNGSFISTLTNDLELAAVGTIRITHLSLVNGSNTTIVASVFDLGNTGNGPGRPIIISTDPVVLPIPAAAVLFGTGLIGLGSLLTRKAGTSQT